MSQKSHRFACTRFDIIKPFAYRRFLGSKERLPRDMIFKRTTHFFLGPFSQVRWRCTRWDLRGSDTPKNKTTELQRLINISYSYKKVQFYLLKNLTFEINIILEKKKANSYAILSDPIHEMFNAICRGGLPAVKKQVIDTCVKLLP